jgi:hypothetical protein
MGYFRKVFLSPLTLGAFKFKSKGEKAEIERRKQTELLEQIAIRQAQIQQDTQYRNYPPPAPEYRNYPPPAPEYRNYPPPKKPSWWNNYNR